MRLDDDYLKLVSPWVSGKELRSVIYAAGFLIHQVSMM